MKMIYSFLLLLCAATAQGQSVKYDQIIPPDHVNQTLLEERLVQLAWKNYPQNRVAELELERAEGYASKANWDWLNRITISGNLNEFTLNPETHTRAEFFPRYNFNLTIPLGVLVDQTSNARIARANVAIEEEQIKQLKLRVRSEVLTRYEEYKRTNDLLKEKIAFLQTLERRLIQLQTENPKPHMNDVNRISDQIAQSKQDVIIWTSNSKLVKVKLEEYIGVRLEEVSVP